MCSNVFFASGPTPVSLAPVVCTGTATHPGVLPLSAEHPGCLLASGQPALPTVAFLPKAAGASSVLRSRGNQEAINLFRRWQHNCEIQPCSEAERQSHSVPQLIAVHLDGCSWLCRLHLWGGRLAQPCRALAAARELWHLCTREQHTPWGRAHSTQDCTSESV